MPGGGANLGLIDACEGEGLRFVLCHGETAGAIMASTYAELTGVPGACLATRGPGAASLANGVAHAWLDRCPMLAVTDVVAAGQRARISHQRLLDQRRLLGAAAKASWTVGAGGGEPVTAALAHALSPPWGQVHLDVDPGSASSIEPPPAPLPAPDAGALRETRRALGSARRPLLLAGVGCRGSEQQVASFAAGHGLPVLTTYKAKGTVDELSSSAAGPLTGATIEAPVLAAADLILAVGLDPVELIPAPWPDAAPVVALGPWIGDAAYLEPRESLVAPVPRRSTWFPVASTGAAGYDGTAVPRAREGEALPCRRLRRPLGAGRRARCPGGVSGRHDRHGRLGGSHARGDGVVGRRRTPSRTHLERPGHDGIRVAGRHRGRPPRATRRIVCFTGDGGLGMCLAELETLARLNLPVTVIVLDDAGLSLIAAKQRPGADGGANAVRYREVDFAAVARSSGLPAVRVSERAALRATLAQARSSAGPLLVDAVIDPAGYPAVLGAIRGKRHGAMAAYDPAQWYDFAKAFAAAAGALPGLVVVAIPSKR